DQRVGASAQGIFFLFAVERLLGQLLSILRRLQAGPVLLQGKLRVAHLHTDLIAQLLQAQLGLAVFELAADAIRLRGAVANGNDEVQTHALVGRAAVKKSGEGVRQTSVKAATGRRRGRWRSAEQRCRGIASQPRSSVEAK